MSKKEVTGRARGARMDAAEKWLSEHDPQYAQNRRSWQTPTTDALAHALSDLNEPHPTLADLEPVPGGNGNYRRRRTTMDGDWPVAHSDVLEGDAAPLEDDYSEESKP